MCVWPPRTVFHQRIQASSFAPHVRLHFDDGGAEQKLQANGWPQAQLHYEFFSVEPAKLETVDSFEVTLASLGKVVKVARDQTVVQALAAAGVEVPTSCEQGVCGTCLTRVISGKPDYRDMYGTSECSE